jgi:hypothetical protein
MRRLWEGDMMRIVVADEISPDSCRLWDIKSKDKLDKDRFRRDMGGLLEAYTEVARRLGILGENEKPGADRRAAPGAVSVTAAGSLLSTGKRGRLRSRLRLGALALGALC